MDESVALLEQKELVKWLIHIFRGTTKALIVQSAFEQNNTRAYQRTVNRIRV